MIKKLKNGKWATVHCHGDKKGEIINTFDTKEEALAQHKAIEISKLKVPKKEKKS